MVTLPCGIRYTQESGAEVYLPLETLEVHAEIVDGEYVLGVISRTFG